MTEDDTFKRLQRKPLSDVIQSWHMSGFDGQKIGFRNYLVRNGWSYDEYNDHWKRVNLEWMKQP